MKWLNIWELRAWGKKQIETQEADQLLMGLLGIDRHSQLFTWTAPITNTKFQQFRRMIVERQTGKPIQYILGYWDFMGLKLEINQDVLIPRNDTEFLVRQVCEGEKERTKGLEIGIGSGCISIALTMFGNMQMTGVDICPKALAVAKTNFERIVGMPHKFLQSNLFDNLTKGDKFDFIVSNPPYIPTDHIEGLDASVKDFEPNKALNGGTDGLDFYRKIVGAAKDWLVNGGRIYFEIGHNMGNAVESILQEGGFLNIKITKDLSGHDRVITAFAK